MGAQMGGACLCQPEPDPTAVEVRLLPPGAAVTLLSQQLAGKPAEPAGRAAANSAEQGEEEPAALQFARRASQVDCSKPRLLLVSDNLPCHELLLSAVKESTVAVPVRYSTWGLGELRVAVVERAGEPKKQFQTVGILDHGEPGEFCLLESLCGGTLDQQKVQQSEEAQLFLKFLSGFVHAPDDPAKFRECLDARIDLMNCSVYAGKGEDFVAYLEDLTQVNWAASNNKTGFGSDWIMESDEGLGDVAACYFREPELLQWRFTAADDEEPVTFECQGDALSFTDGVSGVEGQPCVVSFPGKFEKEWNWMVFMVTLSKVLKEKQPDNNALFSTACVFLPEGTEHYGSHWLLNEQGVESGDFTGDCFCSKLYHGKKEWGCYWFCEWRKQLEKAREGHQKLVVVYKKKPSKSSMKSSKLKWDKLPPFSTSDKELGGSQRGEVAWLQKEGLPYEVWDLEDFMEQGKTAMDTLGTSEFAKAILGNADLQKKLPIIMIEDNDVASEDFFKAVRLCTNLRLVSLVNCKLNADGMKKLAKALHHTKKLKTLDLSHNPLGDEGAKELSELLPKLKKRLRTLAIHSANIGDEGAAALANAFTGCDRLKYVKIAGNSFGEGADAAIRSSKEELEVE